MTDLATRYDDYGLDEQEQQLLYNVEVLGLSVKRAGAMAGVADPQSMLQRGNVMVAREKLRAALRERLQITREDVVNGIKTAIDQAVILADPMAQIAGWREIAKILGIDKTPNVNVHIQGTLEQVQKQLQGLPLEQLMKEAGQIGNVVDVDFYRVQHEE
jgi:hypothetical protein